MAKKSIAPTGSTDKEAVPKPKKPDVPYSAKEVAKLISDKDSEIPEMMKVNRTSRVITMHFDQEIPNVLNTLNHYTDELRKAFATASLPRWKAIFMANGKQYVSTL